MAIRAKQEEKKEYVRAGYTKLRTGEELATAEFQDRCNIWDLYYEGARDSHEHERYLQQRIAAALGDWTFVKGCGIQARMDIENKNITKRTQPPWPDPRFIRWSKVEEKPTKLSNRNWDIEEEEFTSTGQQYLAS